MITMGKSIRQIWVNLTREVKLHAPNALLYLSMIDLSRYSATLMTLVVLNGSVTCRLNLPCVRGRSLSVILLFSRGRSGNK